MTLALVLVLVLAVVIAIGFAGADLLHANSSIASEYEGRHRTALIGGHA